MSEVKDRYDFANGWTIVVNEIMNGQVYFQRWPPGTNASLVTILCRMPIAEFLDAVNKQRESEATHV